MEDRGVLLAIRSLLSDGRTTREVIERGFAPGSVYKANRQLKRGSGPRDRSVSSVAQVSPEIARGLTALSARVDEALGCFVTYTGTMADQRKMTNWLHGEYEKDLEAVERERDEARRRVRELEAQLAELEPLRVWAGLPCAVCGEPVSEQVARDIAKKVTERLAHPSCLRERDEQRWISYPFLDREVPAS